MLPVVIVESVDMLGFRSLEVKHHLSKLIKVAHRHMNVSNGLFLELFLFPEAPKNMQAYTRATSY